MALALAKDGVSELSGHVDPSYGRVNGTPLTVIGSASVSDGLRRSSLVATAPMAPVGLASFVNVKFTFVPAADEWRGDITLRSAEGLDQGDQRRRRLRPRDRQDQGRRQGREPVADRRRDRRQARLHARRGSAGTARRHPPVDHRRPGGDGGHVQDGSRRDGRHARGRLRRDRRDPARPRDLRPPRHGCGRFAGAMRSGFPLGATKPRVGVDFALTGFSDGLRTFGAEGRGLLALDSLSIKSNAVASNTGMAACGTIGFFTGGFGYTYATRALTVMGPFVCDVGAWRATASVAQAGGARTLRLGAGNTVLRLTGRDAAPVAILRGPGGRIVTVPAAGEPGIATHDAVVIRDPAVRTTYVALRDAKGTWTVEPQPGSAIAGIDGAAIEPPPAVTAKVSGRGAKRALRWSVSGTRPGQKVSFVELGKATTHALGTVGGRRGTLRFAPGAGPAGARRIVATVEQGGLPRKRSVVARYSAPGAAARRAARQAQAEGHGQQARRALRQGLQRRLLPRAGDAARALAPRRHGDRQEPSRHADGRAADPRGDGQGVRDRRGRAQGPRSDREAEGAALGGPLAEGRLPATAQSGSSSMPWRRTISAAFSGGRTLAGGTVGASAGTLTSSMKSSKPPGVRTQSMRAPSGPTVNACGMSRGPNACWPAPSSTVCVADLDRHRSLEDVEALVLAVVDVQRDLEARGRGDLDERVLAAGVGGGRLDLGEHAEEPALLAAGGGGLREIDAGSTWVPPCGAVGGVGENDAATIIRGENSSRKCLRENTT